MELKHELENLFLVLCECDSFFLNELYLKKRELFSVCLFTKKYFLVLKNIVFYYFYELEAALERAEKKKPSIYEEIPTNLCVWIPHANPDDLFYGIACYSQYGLPQPLTFL